MRSFKKAVKIIAIVLFFVTFVVGAGSYLILRGSLPQTSGKQAVAGLIDEVTIDRDSLGIPTIYAKNRIDIARATGFLHAQDRFFQMDLIRRKTAGELSELFGSKTLEMDKARRLHGARNIAEQSLKILTEDEQKILTAYTEGVNQGLKALSVKPFEYILIRAEPAPWKPEDSLLVGYGLFFELQDSSGRYDLSRGTMERLLPKSVYDFFVNNGSAWQAALDDSIFPIQPIPDKSQFKYLESSNNSMHITFQNRDNELLDYGSNQWAVDGQHTMDGNALLACDMHLSLNVPNVWYRAGFIYSHDKLGEIKVYGVTLPGMPLLIAGSNTKIAWGFTAAYVDTTDLIIIDKDFSNSQHYMTPEGSQPITIRKETILVKGQDPLIYDVPQTIWGPIMPGTYFGNDVAIKWIADSPDSFNIRLFDLETATNVEQAFQASKKIKTPILNFVVADSQGRIGWIPIGGIPKRKGYDGTIPVSFADGKNAWLGIEDPEKYPKIYNPKMGRVWTANNRILGKPGSDLLGTEGFRNGIRAFQIRKKLYAQDKSNAKDMLAIQLDDEALFFERWQKLLINLLNNNSNDSKIKELIPVVESWGGRGSVDSAGYYWVRKFRQGVMLNVSKRLLKPCFDAWEGFRDHPLDFEEPIWLIVSQQPDYLIDPNKGSWEKELLSIVHEMFNHDRFEASLHEETWGKHSMLNIKHPLSRGFPILGYLLDMPAVPVSGDLYMPRVMHPLFGASERMVVSPGNEKEGIFHSPCGQSGHPLSPNYMDCHHAWVEGLPTPFLPGPTIQTLILTP